MQVNRGLYMTVIVRICNKVPQIKLSLAYIVSFLSLILFENKASKSAIITT